MLLLYHVMPADDLGLEHRNDSHALNTYRLSTNIKRQVAKQHVNKGTIDHVLSIESRMGICNNQYFIYYTINKIFCN